MPQITKIEQQKNNTNRYNLHLDGNYFCALDYETIIKCNLREGKQIEISDIENAQEINEKQHCLNNAVDYLSRGLKTKMQMITYLKKHGYTGKIIAYVIDKLQEYGYINDSRYAQAFINSYINKKGVIYIKAKLIEKGIKKEIFEPLLDQIDNQQEQAYNELIKYFKHKEYTKENLQKAYKSLLQKGYKYSDAESAINKIKEEKWDQF